MNIFANYAEIKVDILVLTFICKNYSRFWLALLKVLSRKS